MPDAAGLGWEAAAALQTEALHTARRASHLHSPMVGQAQCSGRPPLDTLKPQPLTEFPSRQQTV